MSEYEELFKPMLENYLLKVLQDRFKCFPQLSTLDDFEEFFSAEQNCKNRKVARLALYSKKKRVRKKNIKKIWLKDLRRQNNDSTGNY